MDQSKVKKVVAVADSVLQSYTGQYELMPGFVITITRDKNQLMGQPTGQDAIPLFPLTQNRFFIKVVDAEIEFVKDDKGVVTKLLLYQNGMHEGKKIK